MASRDNLVLVKKVFARKKNQLISSESKFLCFLEDFRNEFVPRSHI